MGLAPKRTAGSKATTAALSLKHYTKHYITYIQTVGVTMTDIMKGMEGKRRLPFPFWYILGVINTGWKVKRLPTPHVFVSWKQHYGHSKYESIESR